VQQRAATGQRREAELALTGAQEAVEVRASALRKRDGVPRTRGLRTGGGLASRREGARLRTTKKSRLTTGTKNSSTAHNGSRASRSRRTVSDRPTAANGSASATSAA